MQPSRPLREQFRLLTSPIMKQQPCHIRSLISHLRHILRIFSDTRISNHIFAELLVNRRVFLQLVAGPLEQIAIPTGDDCGLVDETACVQPGDGEFVVPEESTLLHCVEGGGGRHDDDVMFLCMQLLW